MKTRHYSIVPVIEIEIEIERKLAGFAVVIESLVDRDSTAELTAPPHG